METKHIGDFVEWAYTEYGKYINSSRALPYIYDGLKPSYRRVIYAQIMSGGQKQKTLDLIGRALRTHPHGDRSLRDVITELVQRHVFDGHGSFGYNAMYGASMGASAPRYTATNIKSGWYNLIKELIDIVPYKVSDADDTVMEPEYLPVPIPIMLCIGTFGIGLGISTQIPAFSPISILQAYKANDYRLLKPAFDIEFDADNSELEKYWTYGKAMLNFKYHVEWGTDEKGRKGCWVTGNTQTFTPNWSKLEEWRAEGQIVIEDLSKGEKGCVFVGKNKGCRKITDDELWDLVIEATSSVYAIYPTKQAYNIGVYNGEYSEYLSMYQWIDLTYKNYLKLYEKYRNKKIDSLLFERKVYEFLPRVAKLILKNSAITDEEIYQELPEIEEDVLAAIMKKSISTLRKSADTSGKIQSIDNSIEYYKNLDVEAKIEESLKSL